MARYSLICSNTRGGLLKPANTMTVIFDAEDDAEAVSIALNAYGGALAACAIAEVWNEAREQVWEKA
jgi:hypothetical protein